MGGSTITCGAVMDKIVRLDEYRARAMEKKAFGLWEKRFGIAFGAPTRFSDLDDATLYTLAEPGDESSEAFYELVMGVLDLGHPAAFHYLPNADQMKVVEAHLFLADLSRFEMMRRLGWLAALPCSDLSLVELVLNQPALQEKARTNPPELNVDHPAYQTYQAMVIGDKQVFIRQLLTEALAAFKERGDIDA
jgi:hypothetical protein